MKQVGPGPWATTECKRTIPTRAALWFSLGCFRSIRLSNAKDCAMPGGAVTGTCEAAELFDIDVDQLAWLLALIAAHRNCRLQRADPVEP